MTGRILITGGAGFIGSHLADALLRRGYSVRAFDNLTPQVHGDLDGAPEYLDDEVELIAGDVRDPEGLQAALRGVDAVFHLAAMVGVGQSMYEIARYTEVNNVGTAVLLDALVKRPVERLVVASSMSIYGEGLYRTKDGQVVDGVERHLGQLRQGEWELSDATGPLEPLPTPESKTPSLASIYALSKYDQERMCLMVGAAYGIPAVGLRFFNVYGPRQALSNPYTGVLAIFASRLLNGNRPLIYEDGRQRRDFVSVYDVAAACILALEEPQAAGQVFNVGSGRAISIVELARSLAAQLGRKHLKPQITRKYRVGDIRHCFADVRRAQELLGYEPRVSLEDGIADLAEWLEGRIAVDKVIEATRALERRGLTV
jgi:dTDP-L-rhamnose 4-epimerase